MARGAEYGERHERQKNRVKARDDRRAGDARIAKHLGNVHRGEGQAREDIPHRLARLKRQKTAKEVEAQSLRLPRLDSHGLVPPLFRRE